MMRPQKLGRGGRCDSVGMLSEDSCLILLYTSAQVANVWESALSRASAQGGGTTMQLRPKRGRGELKEASQDFSAVSPHINYGFLCPLQSSRAWRVMRMLTWQQRSPRPSVLEPPPVT